MNPRVVQPNDQAYLKAAFSLINLSEIEGARHEKRVLAMYAASGHPEIHDDETPWCAAFIGDCLKQGALTGTNSLLARSYEKYGTHINPNGIIPRGAIAVWTRAGGGHVNFVLSDDGTYVICIGGNQSNGKSGGVTISRRLKAEAVAFRMPPGIKAVPLPRPKPHLEPAPLPDVEPADEVTPKGNQPDDPIIPAAPVPWYKQPFVWVGSLMTGGALGGVQLSVDAQFLWGASFFVFVVAMLFVGWVYALPPRGKFWKGVFK